MPGKLYIVPTPIGNLEDITLRAIRILKKVELILAEDSRQTKKLLDHLGFQKKVFSHHKFNERESSREMIEWLKNGKEIALVSDSGTPLISDPGFNIVNLCIENLISVECLPGPTAFVPALVLSGFGADSFLFEGFLPHKKGRQTLLKKLADEERTIILYESPHRLLKTLEQLQEFFGAERKISVSRELTKLFEETTRGSIKDVLLYFTKKGVKGEFVLVIEGKHHKREEKEMV